MLSDKPYLIRAIYSWIVDSHCTPYILVNAELPNVQVPKEHIDEDGQVVFNISSEAVKDLQIANNEITFTARFSGVSRKIYIPIYAALGIYAMENEEGMFFDPALEEFDDIEGDESDFSDNVENIQSHPYLKVVSSDIDDHTRHES